MQHLFALLAISLAFIPLGSCQSGWTKYYSKKLYLPPATPTKEAVKDFHQAGVAVDLGCGCGNDTAFLLDNGWTVFAIDKEPSALEILKKRKDIQDQNHLFTLTSTFETIDWQELPQANLFLAIYALPFCKQEHFKELWQHIVDKIEPEGKFAGHFFAPDYQGFHEKEKASMTFLTKEEVERLFQGFEIELFEEEKEEGQSTTGRVIHSHIFTVIAKKHV